MAADQHVEPATASEIEALQKNFTATFQEWRGTLTPREEAVLCGLANFVRETPPDEVQGYSWLSQGVNQASGGAQHAAGQVGAGYQDAGGQIRQQIHQQNDAAAYISPGTLLAGGTMLIVPVGLIVIALAA